VLSFPVVFSSSLLSVSFSTDGMTLGALD
jgi:hypothetical protein